MLRAARLALQHGNLFLSETCCTEVLAWCTDFPKLRAYASCLLIDTLYHAGKTEDATRVCREAWATADVTRPWQLSLTEREGVLAIASRDFYGAQACCAAAARRWVRPTTSPVFALRLRHLASRATYRASADGKDAARLAARTAAMATCRDILAATAALPTANRTRVRDTDLGRLLIDAGDYPAAIAVLTTQYAACEAEQDLFGRRQVALALCKACRLAGRLDDAGRWNDIALRLARATTELRWVMECHHHHAAIAYGRRQYAHALQAYRRCLAVLAALPQTREFHGTRLHVQVWLGHCYKALNERPLAEAVFRAVVDEPALAMDDRVAARLGLAAVTTDPEVRVQYCALAAADIQTLPESQRLAYLQEIQEVRATGTGPALPRTPRPTT